MGPSSTSPYRDETQGLASQCARLEDEVRMLRRSVRTLSSRTAVCTECARRLHPRRRQPSRIAKAIALVVTMLLTLTCVTYPRQMWGCKTPKKKGFEATLMAFSGLG